MIYRYERDFFVTNTSVTFTLRRPYGGRRTPKSSDSCGCRRNSAVAAGPPYGESLCFTGRRGGRRIIARSYNFFHFYVRRRNLTRRSHAVDRTVAVRSPCGRLAYALIFVIKTTAAAGTPYGNGASSPQRTSIGQPQFFCLQKLRMRRTAAAPWQMWLLGYVAEEILRRP